MEPHPNGRRCLCYLCLYRRRRADARATFAVRATVGVVASSIQFRNFEPSHDNQILGWHMAFVVPALTRGYARPGHPRFIRER